jgi:hypothetical protein
MIRACFGSPGIRGRAQPANLTIPGNHPLDARALAPYLLRQLLALSSFEC